MNVVGAKQNDGYKWKIGVLFAETLKVLLNTLILDCLYLYSRFHSPEYQGYLFLPTFFSLLHVNVKQTNNQTHSHTVANITSIGTRTLHQLVETNDESRISD